MALKQWCDVISLGDKEERCEKLLLWVMNGSPMMVLERFNKECNFNYFLPLDY